MEKNKARVIQYGDSIRNKKNLCHKIEEEDS